MTNPDERPWPIPIERAAELMTSSDNDYNDDPEVDAFESLRVLVDARTGRPTTIMLTLSDALEENRKARRSETYVWRLATDVEVLEDVAATANERDVPDEEGT